LGTPYIAGFLKGNTHGQQFEQPKPIHTNQLPDSRKSIATSTMWDAE